MKTRLRFFDDGTMELAIFAPGDHHGTGEEWTDADLDELVATYDPSLQEAPNVIGHAEQRASGDPAYGWVESLFKRDGLLWARLKQVPEEFKEWVDKGYWKKRSVEIYTNFRDTGKKYLRAIAWLGAQPPAVAGLPDVTFVEDGGPFETVDCAEEREGQLRRAWEALRGLFAEEGAGGPIAKAMNREDALVQFDRIKWLASDELYRIVDDLEMDDEEKRTQLRALFDDLRALIEDNGTDLINAFAERSPDMAKDTQGAPQPQGTITLTAEQLQEQISTSVQTALAQFQEQQAQAIETQVSQRFEDLSKTTRQNAIKVFCARLKERGLAPAHVDGGLAVFMEQLSFQETQAFTEGGAEQSPAQWFEQFVEGVVAAARTDKLLVPQGEIAGGDPPPEHQDAKARALAEFEEHKDFYQAMGLTAEDLEKYDGILHEEAG